MLRIHKRTKYLLKASFEYNVCQKILIKLGWSMFFFGDGKKNKTFEGKFEINTKNLMEKSSNHQFIA